MERSVTGIKDYTFRSEFAVGKEDKRFEMKDVCLIKVMKRGGKFKGMRKLFSISCLSSFLYFFRDQICSPFNSTIDIFSYSFYVRPSLLQSSLLFALSLHFYSYEKNHLGYNFLLSTIPTLSISILNGTSFFLPSTLSHSTIKITDIEH